MAVVARPRAVLFVATGVADGAADGKGASMTEPVAFLCDATRFKMSFDDEGRVSCFGHFSSQLDGEWVALVPAANDKHLRYTSPAQAPASLRDMTEADFDQAHGIAPAGVPDVWAKHEGGRGWQKGEQPNPQWACARYDELLATGKHGHYETLMRVVKDACYRAHDLGMEDYKAANPPPAGVPDVAELARKLRGGFWTTKEQLQVCEKAATALAALQENFSQQVFKTSALRVIRNQQAECITELKAKLAEAVRLIELSTAKGTTHCGWYAERDAFLNKAREVMG